METDSAGDGLARSSSGEDKGKAELERLCEEHPEIAKELRDRLDRLDLTTGTVELKGKDEEPPRHKDDKSPEEVFSSLFHSLNRHRTAYERYERQLLERHERQAQTLARLTGWRLSEIRQKMTDPSRPSPAAESGDDSPWWRRIWD